MYAQKLGRPPQSEKEERQGVSPSPEAEDAGVGVEGLSLLVTLRFSHWSLRDTQESLRVYQVNKRPGLAQCLSVYFQ